LRHCERYGSEYNFSYHITRFNGGCWPNAVGVKQILMIVAERMPSKHLLILRLFSACP
jgi:hypothetical protein